MSFSIFSTGWQGLVVSILAVIAINVVNIIVTAIYNLYFHPLRKFPGPTRYVAFPILSYLERVFGSHEANVAAYAEAYGDVFRCGPGQLIFTSAQAWKDIYGHGHAELPKYFPPGLGFDTEPQIISANAADHFRFRRAMLPAFSEKALALQEPLIKGYVDLMMKRLEEVSAVEEYVDMVEWYTFITFDLIGDLAYGESFNNLKSGKSNEWIVTIDKMMRLFPLFAMVTASPIISKILFFFASDAMKNARANHLKRAYDLTMKRISNKEQEHRGDFMDFLMRAQGEKHGLTDVELARNSDTLLLAGSETTATLLSGVTFFLLKNPTTLEKCTVEVRTAFATEEEIDFKSASSKLPYMLACLNEALRLFPPVAAALFRVTLPGAPTPVGGRLVPPNTRVGIHHLATYTSEKNFHRAKEFLPERWLPESTTDPSSPFYNDNREVHKPFSYGPRDCIGRNLAYQEMRLILSRILWNFDLALAEECSEWSNQRVFALWEKPPLKVKLNKRKG